MATTQTIDDFRKLALSLPNAVESAHMNHPDFRVLCADGKLRIFATLSGEERGVGVLKLTLDQQDAFCEEMPAIFEPVQGGWGRMGMTYVQIAAADRETLLGGLTTAHRNIVSSAAAVKAKGPAAKGGRAKAGASAQKPKIKL